LAPQKFHYRLCRKNVWQATLENYGQKEMPELDDQASKHNAIQKMKTTVSEKVSF